MITIKKLLYPTDFSPRSMHGYKYCLRLAHQLGASVHVLHVYRIDLGVPITDAIAYKMVNERKKNSQLELMSFAHLKKSKQESLTDGLDIRAHTMAGMPEDEIVAFAKKHQIDLIVMPTKGEHDLLETLFGSVTTAVGTTAECPMLILPEKAIYRPITDVVYATDLSAENKRKAQTPVQLAQLFGAKLHFLHVYQDRKATPEDVAALLAGVPEGLGVEYHDLKGDSVQEAVHEYIKMHNIDLLVAYSPPKNFFERLFRLSTTRHLLDQVTCPLMILR